MIGDLVLYLIGFSIFVCWQSIGLNGLYECFKGSAIEIDGKMKYQGMIFYMVAPQFFERNRNKMFAKMWNCVRCISGWAGTISFWMFVIPLFGFHWFELIIWVFDIFILVSLNYFFYKRI